MGILATRPRSCMDVQPHRLPGALDTNLHIVLASGNVLFVTRRDVRVEILQN